MTEDKKLIEATCPECRGPLRRSGTATYPSIAASSVTATPPVDALQAHSEAQEKALWAAVVALEESA